MPAQTVFEERIIPTNRMDVVGWVHQLLVWMVCMICILSVVYVVRIFHFLNHPMLTVSSQCHTRLNSYICSRSWDSTCYIPSSGPNVSGGCKDRRIPGLTMLPIGYLHTDFIRRFLLRGKVEEVGGTRVMKCLIKDGQRLYQPKDRQTKGVITVQGIRELLGAIPKVLGDFVDGGNVSNAVKFNFALEAPPRAVDLDESQGDELFGDEAPELTWAEALEKYTLLTPDAVSYTHLTLPTKRIV